VRERLLIGLSIVALAVCGSAVGVVASVGTAAAQGSSQTAAEAESRADAVLDARKRLGALQVPPGARPVASLPNRLRLDGPGITIGSPNFLYLKSFWVSPDPPEQVLGWFHNHPPLGSVISDSGSFGIGHEIVVRELGFEFPEIPEVASSRYLRISVAARGEHGSAFRADSQAVWIVPHPSSEQIPPAADVIDAELSVEGKRKRSAVVADQGKVAGIAALIDRLVPFQPGEYFSLKEPRGSLAERRGFCECFPGEEERKERKIVLTFRHGRQGPVLAKVVQELPPGYTSGLQVTIRGKRESTLEEGWRLVRRLRTEGILLR
jgi:hypothetical protein